MAKRKAKPTAKAKPSEDGRSEIEALRARYKDLHDRKVAAGANLKTSQKALERLKEKARAEYGTDDIDELREKLNAMKAENEKRRQEYEKHLDEIDVGLEKIDREHKAAEGEADGKV